MEMKVGFGKVAIKLSQAFSRCFEISLASAPKDSVFQMTQRQLWAFGPWAGLSNRSVAFSCSDRNAKPPMEAEFNSFRATDITYPGSFA